LLYNPKKYLGEEGAQTDIHLPPSPFTGKFLRHLGLESISYLVHALTLANPVSEMPELEAVAGYSLVLLLLVIDLKLLLLVSPRGARLQKVVQRRERLCPRQSLEKEKIFPVIILFSFAPKWCGSFWVLNLDTHP
jgi:hypothetical protein